MKTSKNKKNLLPTISAPVERVIGSTSTALSSQCIPSTECDLATRQCTPFAGDDAE